MAVSEVVTIPADESTACVQIPIVDDFIALEPNKTFSVSLELPDDVPFGSTSSTTVTVVDNDGKKKERKN